MIKSQKRKEDPRKKDSQIADSNKHEMEIFFNENYCSWVHELMIRIHRSRFCKGAIAQGIFVYTHIKIPFLFLKEFLSLMRELDGCFRFHHLFYDRGCKIWLFCTKTMLNRHLKKISIFWFLFYSFQFFDNLKMELHKGHLLFLVISICFLLTNPHP